MTTATVRTTAILRSELAYAGPYDPNQGRFVVLVQSTFDQRSAPAMEEWATFPAVSLNPVHSGEARIEPGWAVYAQVIRANDWLEAFAKSAELFFGRTPAEANLDSADFRFPLLQARGNVTFPGRVCRWRPEIVEVTHRALSSARPHGISAAIWDREFGSA